MRDLRIESGFAPGNYTKMVPERVARRQALTKRLHAYVGEVVELSDRALLLKGAAKERRPMPACSAGCRPGLATARCSAT